MEEKNKIEVYINEQTKEEQIKTPMLDYATNDDGYMEYITRIFEQPIQIGEVILDFIQRDLKENSYPMDLSGGQKQRVAIIRSLMMNPEVILFDEPTSALDPEMIGEVLSLILEVSREKITMIVVTHELNFAQEFATRVIFMDHGKIIEEGDKEQMFKHPRTNRLQQFLSNIQ